MSWRLAVWLVLAACGKRADAPIAPADAAAVDAPGSTRAWIASPPRSAWACGFTIDEQRGFAARAIALFRYGDRTSCRLPVTLVARGIWGCPESYTRTDPDGRIRELRLRYDAAGHVVEHDGEHFVWNADRLVSTQRGTFVERDDGAMLVDAAGTPLEAYRLSGDPVTRVDRYVDGKVASWTAPWWQRGTLRQLGTHEDWTGRQLLDLQTFACPTGDAPVNISFVRFDLTAIRPAGGAILVRIENPTAHVVYRIGWQVRYRDAAGTIVPFMTKLGITDHDTSSWAQTWPILRPHETKVIAMPLNEPVIPPSATRADLVITDLADGTGQLWYSRPLDPASRPREP